MRTPSLTVYLDETLRRDSEQAKEVQAKLEYTTLGDVTSVTQIYYDPDPEDTIVDEDREFVQSYCEVPDEDFDPRKMSPWVLRIELNRELIADKKLRMDEIAARITEDYANDIHVIYSDDNAEKLVLRIRIVTDEEDKALEQDESFNGQEDDVFLKRLEKNMLSKLKLRGVEDVKKVYIKEVRQIEWTRDGGFPDKPKDEWILETDGSNLMEVLSDESVDHTRTISNDIVEICTVLGIEGTRAALLNMLREVISFDGAYVNYRHLSVLCDVMTFRGHLMAITRHGINRADSGPLLRCSFEETVEILMEAAMFARFDELNGVTQNIMLGQLAHIGTGTMDLLLDEQQLKQAVETAPPDQPQRPHGGAGAGTPMAMTPYGATPHLSPGVASPHASPYTGMFSPAASSPAFSPYGFSPAAASPSVEPTSSPAYSERINRATPACAPETLILLALPPIAGPTSPAYSANQSRVAPARARAGADTPRSPLAQALRVPRTVSESIVLRTARARLPTLSLPALRPLAGPTSPAYSAYQSHARALDISDPPRSTPPRRPYKSRIQ